MAQRVVEIGGLAVLVALLVLVGVVALMVEIRRRARAWWRHRAVARELAAMGLPPVPRPRAVSGHRRSAVVRPEVPALRPGEPRDPGAAKVLAFRIELARKGYYVDELQIRKRIN